jgi:hypothetical protein
VSNSSYPECDYIPQVVPSKKQQPASGLTVRRPMAVSNLSFRSVIRYAIKVLRKYNRDAYCSVHWFVSARVMIFFGANKLFENDNLNQHAESKYWSHMAVQTFFILFWVK